MLCTLILLCLALLYVQHNIMYLRNLRNGRFSIARSASNTCSRLKSVANTKQAWCNPKTLRQLKLKGLTFLVVWENWQALIMTLEWKTYVWFLVWKCHDVMIIYICNFLRNYFFFFAKWKAVWWRMHEFPSFFLDFLFVSIKTINHICTLYFLYFSVTLF